ncbi:TPA: molybdopterin-dependent oxidoreductase [Klebsiella pneumoniae]
MKTIRTTCPYCGVGCGVLASVDDAGQVSVRGDDQHPANLGRLCVKGAALGETTGLAGRLLTPEVDGQQVAWPQALAETAARLRQIIDQHGPQAVAFYASGQLLTEDYYAANKLMKGFIGAANIDTNSRLCMSSAVTGYKRAFGADVVPCSYDDVENSDLVVLVGSNAAWAHPVLFQRLAQAKRDNPRLRIVAIDPRRTATCEIADRHLALAPGSDGGLFAGLLNALAEAGACVDGFRDGPQALAAARGWDVARVAAFCGLPADEVAGFYREFIAAPRAITLYTMGINQSASGSDKCNAIINVHLASGKYGRRGCGPFSLTGQPNAMGGREVGGLATMLAAHMDFVPDDLQRLARFWGTERLAQTPGLTAVELFAAIGRGEVKAVWIMGTNPVVSLPDSHAVSQALAAVDPAWESKSDWEIYKGIAKKFSEVCVGHLGKETDVVTLPIQHDSAAEMAQPLDVKDWKKGECDLIPGKTAPHIIPVERDYPATYERFTSIGPLLETIGNGGKGIAWNTQSEMDLLRKLNYTKAEGPAKGQPKLETAIDAAEMILTLAPETNGQVAVKAWQALSEFTGRDHAHLALNKEDEKIRFRDIQAQPRKIISSPTWSGLEDEHVSYNAGYTNVHELIPWRTLSGRQSLYQDHQWMRDFGESLLVYRPPIDTRSVKAVMGEKSNGNPEKALNFLTPHQKWGIHSTYSDNLLMLTLSRGGPIVWMSEADAKDLGIEDNDWIEVFNANGALTARAVVSQRVPAGMTMMYHAQERIVNLPGSEITGQRGGIHNSVTRITPKPTHMIGGYGHLAYGFNYYGTVGSNRDEFVVVRKMKNINWLDGEGNDQVQESVK